MSRNNNRRNRSSSRRRRNAPNPTSNRGRKLSDGMTKNTGISDDKENVRNNIYVTIKKWLGVEMICGFWVSYYVVIVIILGLLVPGLKAIADYKDKQIETEVTDKVEEGYYPTMINSLIDDLEDMKLENEKLEQQKINIKTLSESEKMELRNFYESELEKKDKKIENLNSLLEDDG